MDFVERVRQLWENNVSGKDMLESLQNEGFECRERDITRVRQKNGWLLRQELPATVARMKVTRADPKASKQLDALGHGHLSGPNTLSGDDAGETHAHNILMPDAVTTSPQQDDNVAVAEDINERRRQALAAEAEEKRLTRKRRRWTRSHGGIPADAPGPPRFPSEMTLGECRSVLSMDQGVYRDVRTKFRAICEAHNIYKKTVSGAEIWEAAKHELTRETMHLRGVFWDPENTDMKKLALDLICRDVTKTIRDATRRLPVSQARTILGLNPEQSRSVRLAFQVMLRAQQFVCKRLIPDDEWHELKQSWINQTPILEQIMTASSPADPDHYQRIRALEVLCRDAMRRYTDWQRRGIDPLAYAKVPSPEPPNANTQSEQEAADTAEDLEGEFQASRFLMDDSLVLNEGSDADPVQVSQVSSRGVDHPPRGLETETGSSEVPPRRKRGRPRKVPDAGDIAQPSDGPENSPVQPASAAAPRKRGRPPGARAGGTRQVKRVSGGVARLSKNEARFAPIDEAEEVVPATSSQVMASNQSVLMPLRATIGSQQQQPGSRSPKLSQGQLPNQSQSIPRHQTPAVRLQQQHTQAQTPDFLQFAAPLDESAASNSWSTFQAQASSAPSSASSTRPGGTIAVYFRIHPSTTIVYGLPMWITTMSVQSLEAVKLKAVARYPRAMCALVEGIVKDDVGGEIPLPIAGDEELKAYLEHVNETGGAPTFSVQLVHG